MALIGSTNCLMLIINMTNRTFKRIRTINIFQIAKGDLLLFVIKTLLLGFKNALLSAVKANP
jgi:hypothetical protein